MKRLLAAAGILAGIVTSASAQTYPERVITMIVPFAAGGPTDITARIISENMSKTIGQQIIVENVAGAGGTTGITRAAQAKPDGYTIMMGHMGTHGAAPALYPNIKYDPTKDFEYIGFAGGTPILIVAKKDFAPKDLKEFVDHIKKNEDKVNQAHAGVGSVSHTTCELLKSQTGAKSRAVAYRGTGPALNDMVGGQVDYMCDQIVNLVQQVKGGTIKAYAIATEKRSPALPDVPTTKEAGLPEYQVSAWNAIFAPKGTPADVLAKLRGAYQKAMADEGTRKRLEELGTVLPDAAGQTPEHLAKVVSTEVARWKGILKPAEAAPAAPAAAPEKKN